MTPTAETPGRPADIDSEFVECVRDVAEHSKRAQKRGTMEAVWEYANYVTVCAACRCLVFQHYWKPISGGVGAYFCDKEKKSPLVIDEAASKVAYVIYKFFGGIG